MGRYEVPAISSRLSVDILSGDTLAFDGYDDPNTFIAISAGAYVEWAAELTVEQTAQLRDLLTSILEGNR